MAAPQGGAAGADTRRQVIANNGRIGDRVQAKDCEFGSGFEAKAGGKSGDVVRGRTLTAPSGPAGRASHRGAGVSGVIIPLSVFGSVDAARIGKVVGGPGQHATTQRGPRLKDGETPRSSDPETGRTPQGTRPMRPAPSSPNLLLPAFYLPPPPSPPPSLTRTTKARNAVRSRGDRPSPRPEPGPPAPALVARGDPALVRRGHAVVRLGGLCRRRGGAGGHPLGQVGCECARRDAVWWGRAWRGVGERGGPWRGVAGRGTL